MTEDQLQEGWGRGLFTLKNFLILIIGFVLGYVIKGQAVQNITMGYDDYKIVVKKDLQKEPIVIKTKNMDNIQKEVVGENANKN